MRIAVTGASGFIGQHVLAELTDQGIETVAVTRDRARLACFQDRVRIVELDLAQPPADAYEKMGRPEVLLHLAWDGLPNYRSLHHFEVELPGQFRFLKGLLEAGLPSLVVAGTCFEYGMQSGPLSEACPTRPSNPYGYAKDSLRIQLEFFRAAHSFTLTWARLFYLFGTGQTPNSLFPKLQVAAASGDEFFAMSGGEQLRDYLPVSEAARCLVQLGRKRGDFGTVNICSGVPVSIRSLVECWIQEHGWKIRPALGRFPYPDYEPMAFWGERRYLDTLLGPP